MTTAPYYPITPQPTDTTCGPTCLHSVYRHFNDPIQLDAVIADIPELPEQGGGVLDVFLGLHALRRGYSATIYTFNVTLFDPTWFPVRDPAELVANLRAQAAAKDGQGWKFDVATQGYIDFLEAGGRVEMVDLTADLVRRHLKRGQPLLTGLSATWLYRSVREVARTNTDDAVRGEPAGHFVVLCGYDSDTRTAWLADPYADHPYADMPGDSPLVYPVKLSRLISAILLGVVTFDANLLAIRPHGRPRSASTTGERA